MLLSLLRRRFPAWLAIFATLTISIAPVISQMLTHRDRDTSQTLSIATAFADHHHAGHQISGMHHGQTSPSLHPLPASTMDHAACGYCVLFSYTPALADVGGIILALTPNMSRTRAIAFFSRIIPLTRCVSPAPRAPPC
ncbi:MULTISPECIES: DUF2946 domain-containing protein [Brenneria]|uniref:DUF2946 domain-containing protein n=1 Tax=Brenneria nigrifluens DSM 30175 = ATCC 13028 TaxID=1121120 RepID=A0A2U1URY8_9GAMM|nr:MULTISPECIES: DUF2946 domain-containing protein [Brenneria]EHD21014.1 hypothetical protein BrE312_1609 [Brenneria sp. EniD312]PWC24440.1 DUF2946 domain-containing protein [Brenneria nigrifluens DSM 30175 = ATCC 13028]QCR04169.1 DUF2946 domain-containing protein [Brenneria nigrifluens DSM 30175 = ATCC 13028]